MFSSETISWGGGPGPGRATASRSSAWRAWHAHGPRRQLAGRPPSFLPQFDPSCSRPSPKCGVVTCCQATGPNCVLRPPGEERVEELGVQQDERGGGRRLQAPGRRRTLRHLPGAAQLPAPAPAAEPLRPPPRRLPGRSR
jgi:hypothetical protein